MYVCERVWVCNRYVVHGYTVNVCSFVRFLIFVDDIYDLLNFDMNGSMENLCQLQKQKQ